MIISSKIRRLEVSKDITCGDKVYFRVPNKDELRFIKELWEDPETMLEVGGPISWEWHKYEEWFKNRIRLNPNNHYYCLIFNFDDQLVGEVSYRLIDQEKMIGAQNIKIKANHRRNGYAKDALLTFLNYCFNNRGLRLMTDEIAIDNKVSHDFFLNLGFKHCPEKSDHFWVELSKDEFNLKYKKR